MTVLKVPFNPNKPIHCTYFISAYRMQQAGGDPTSVSYHSSMSVVLAVSLRSTLHYDTEDADGRTDGRTKSISAAPTRRPRRRNSCKLVNRILRRRRRNARVRVMFGRHYAFQQPTFLLNDVTNFATWCVKKWGVFLAVVTLAMSKRWMMIMKIFISPYNGSNIQQ